MSEESEKALEKQLQAMRDAWQRSRTETSSHSTLCSSCNQDVINVSQTNSVPIQWYTRIVLLNRLVSNCCCYP